MSANRHFGASLTDDPDDAPELLEGFFKDAEIRRGETVVRPARGPGRPKSGKPKELVSVRLDPDVLAKLREAGPGWQTQLNSLLRRVLGLSEADPHKVDA